MQKMNIPMWSRHPNLTSTIIAIIVMTMIYLCGVFSAVSFDISTWDSFLRGMCAMCMFIGGLMGWLFSRMMIENSKNYK